MGGFLSKSMTRTDKIMTIGGWTMDWTAKCYAGAISSRHVQGGKRECGQSYTDVSELSLSPRVREIIKAMLRAFG